MSGLTIENKPHCIKLLDSCECLFVLLMCESFACVDFQWINKKGEIVKNIFFCITKMNESRMVLEQHDRK